MWEGANRSLQPRDRPHATRTSLGVKADRPRTRSADPSSRVRLRKKNDIRRRAGTRGRRMKSAVSAALGAPTLLALALSSAWAQSAPSTSEARLPSAVVTPSRSVQSLDDALPATSVITRTDIERWQLSDLVGALSRETGVQFAQSGGPGAAASVFIRGANSSQTLVLVDGVPLNAAVSGAAAL